MIDSLEPNHIFVFGSNLQGRHLGGAAKQAHEQFRAEWGIGAGLTGQCYAIPTMEGYDSMALYIQQFLQIASLLPQYTFLLTKVGCGIAGYDENDVKQLFKDAPSNVVKPEGW